jgi:hypothetical protein
VLREQHAAELGDLVSLRRRSERELVALDDRLDDVVEVHESRAVGAREGARPSILVGAVPVLDLDERLIVVRACRNEELSSLFVCEYEDDGHRGGGATCRGR